MKYSVHVYKDGKCIKIIKDLGPVLARVMLRSWEQSACYSARMFKQPPVALFKSTKEKLRKKAEMEMSKKKSKVNLWSKFKKWFYENTNIR